MRVKNSIKIEPKVENPEETTKKSTGMHTFSETGAGVPAFLAKLWRLVEDSETNNLICWSKDGRSFIIQNQAQFARELLPLNYKHNNMASFIRQLNMYGFHKITSIDNGGLKFDRDEMEFTHPCFKRNCPYLLEHIKRKIASTKTVDEKSVLKPEAVTKVLQDVKAMRGRQDSLDTRFSVMKQENEALWREIASLRQKHAKQQQIVNKLIQFLITIVQPQRNMSGVKRHMQLMIDDIPEKPKMHKTSESESDCGPVIHELGEELLDEVSEVETELFKPNSPFARVATPNADAEATAASPQNMERPQSSVSMSSQNFDYSNQSAEDAVAYFTPAAAAAAANDGLIHTLNNDGSQIFYHITEVPDTQPQETTKAPLNYDEEDNVLTTPMVREEMARNQQLKQKNRQRRDKNDADSLETIDSGSTSINAKVQCINLSPTPSQLQPTEIVPQPIQIKSEQNANLDPFLFLTDYPEHRVLTPDPNLISPNLSEDSRQSNSNNTNSFLLNNATQGSSNANTTSSNNEDLLGGIVEGGNTTDLYNPNSFIANDIPADIFEDNSLMTPNDNRYKLAEQQQYGRNTVNTGKFSTYFPGTTGNTSITSQPSTSAAAAAAANTTNDDAEQQKAIAPALPSTSKNASNMALTKYKNNPDILCEDVTGHIDIMQDELDTLKDLLRSDVYSWDHNTLLGVNLPIINAQEEELPSYKDATAVNAGNKQIANSTQTVTNNTDDFDGDVEQTRYKILQFLNDSLFNDLD